MYYTLLTHFRLKLPQVRHHLHIREKKLKAFETVNNLPHIFTWRHSSVVHHEQMGQCDCHVNDVLQSITWGTVVITARVLSPGRGLKVSYDLSWITHGPNNLLRLEDTPRCILNIPPVSPPEQRERERQTERERGGKKGGGEDFFYMAAADIYQPALTDVPYAFLFLLEAQFQFHFVCWQISSAQTRQQWIRCEVFLNRSGRNVGTLFFFCLISQNRGKLPVV